MSGTLTNRLNKKNSRFYVTAVAHDLRAFLDPPKRSRGRKVSQRRQSGSRAIAIVVLGLPWSPNGGTVVDTLIAQWKPLVGQRRHRGRICTGESQASLSLRDVYNRKHFYRVTTALADHCASILQLMAVRSSTILVCLLSVTNLLGDLCVIALNMLKTSRRPGRGQSCVQPLNDQGSHSAYFELPTVGWPVLWSHRGISMHETCTLIIIQW